MIAFTFPLGRALTKCIFVLNKKGEAQKRTLAQRDRGRCKSESEASASSMENFKVNCVDFKDAMTVLVGKELYIFKFGSPVSSYKIADFNNAEHLSITALSTLPRNEHLERFAVT